METPLSDHCKKHTGLLKSLVRSFYTRAIYLEVYQQWRYRIFALLLLLSALTCLSGFIKPIDSIQTFRHNSHKIARQLPTLHFEQYRLSIDRASPCFIKTSSNGSVLMVFDTQEDPKTLASYQPLLFTFGADGFYIHNLNQSHHLRVLDFKRYDQYHLIHLDHLTLTPEEVMHYLSDTLLVVELCLYGLSVVATFIEYLFIASFLGLTIMVIAMTHKLHLSKGGAFRIGAMALVPAGAWFFLLSLLSKADNLWFTFIGFGIAFCYCLLAVNTIKKHQPSTLESKAKKPPA